ncbi:hypothetical protein C7534_107153 [Pseudomonas sp. OV226]|jgi:hypothetical protein|nr:hypothetical protein C7534_107153 [Pseudomonas sp. OV226]
MKVRQPGGRLLPPLPLTRAPQPLPSWRGGTSARPSANCCASLIEHHVVINGTVLGANVTPGGNALIERLTTTGAMLAGKGVDQVAAGRAATRLLGKVVSGQATVIAFDTAFYAVAMLFVVAAPVLVGIKIGLSKYAKVRAMRALAEVGRGVATNKIPILGRFQPVVTGSNRPEAIAPWF